MVHVPVVFKFRGPSTSKFQVVFPETAGLTVKDLEALPAVKPKPLAEAAPREPSKGMSEFLRKFGL
jgi:hypothetical protein